MTGNCLYDPFLLKYIHIYTYCIKKRDSYKLFRLRMKISWEPCSQVPHQYPTLHDPLFWSTVQCAATRNPLCSNLHFSLQELDHWWTVISLLWTTRPSNRMSHCPPPYESDFSPKWTCLVLSLRKSKEGWLMSNQRVARPMLDFRDRDWSFKSLKVETDTETIIFKVSMSRLRPRLKF